MASSDITITSLTATDDLNGIKLSWVLSDPFPVSMHYSTEAIEIWAATVNNRASAVKVGEAAPTSDYTHVGLDRDEVRYYWARARDKINANMPGRVPGYGAFFPVSTTAGIQGIEKSGDVDSLIAQNGYYVHRSGLIEQWGRDALTGGGGSTTITFPMAFPSQCFQVTANVLASPSTSITRSIQVETFDASTVLLSGNQIATPGGVTAPAMTALWRAIGF